MMPNQKHRIAIFDMDKTITRSATFAPFLWHVLRHYRPWRVLALPLMALAALMYGVKLIDRARLKEWNLALLIGTRIKHAKLNLMARSFAAETIDRNVLAGALAEIRQLQAQGWRIILATASYRFYVVEIAHLLGIDDRHDVIATENRRVGDVGEPWVEPWIAGRNCYGGEKADRIDNWLIAREIRRDEAEIRFYSDHVSDAPCLHIADHAIAANPHKPLRDLAQEKGWAIVDWS